MLPMSRQFIYEETDEVGLATLEAIAQAERFNHWMYQVVVSQLRPGPTLEIGSGIGNISQFFLENGWEMTLSDLRPVYCDYLRGEFGSQPSLQQVLPLDLVDPAFERRYAPHLNGYANLYALNVLEHIEDDRRALRHAYQLLRPGGRILILVPAYPWLYNGFDHQLQHYRRYTRAQLAGRFAEAGIPLITTFAFNLIGVLGWFVSGAILRKRLIPTGQMRLYNQLVPWFRQLDRLTRQRWGLSVVAVGEKPEMG